LAATQREILLKRLTERGDTIVAQSITKLELAVDDIFG
jgi:hypothetical protein